MTTFSTATVTCGACGSNFQHNVLASTNRFGSMDLDARPPEMERSTMIAWVQQCPTCGYCAKDVSQFSDQQREVLNSREYRQHLADRSLPALAGRFICSGLLLSASGQHVEFASSTKRTQPSVSGKAGRMNKTARSIEELFPIIEYSKAGNLRFNSFVSQSRVTDHVSTIDDLLAKGAKFPELDARHLRRLIWSMPADELMRLLKVLHTRSAIPVEVLKAAISTPKMRAVLGSKWEEAVALLEPPQPRPANVEATSSKKVKPPPTLEEMQEKAERWIVNHVRNHYPTSFLEKRITNYWTEGEVRRRLSSRSKQGLAPIHHFGHLLVPSSHFGQLIVPIACRRTIARLCEIGHLVVPTVVNYWSNRHCASPWGWLCPSVRWQLSHRRSLTSVFPWAGPKRRPSWPKPAMSFCQSK